MAILVALVFLVALPRVCGWTAYWDGKHPYTVPRLRVDKPYKETLFRYYLQGRSEGEYTYTMSRAVLAWWSSHSRRRGIHTSVRKLLDIELFDLPRYHRATTMQGMKVDGTHVRIPLVQPMQATFDRYYPNHKRSERGIANYLYFNSTMVRPYASKNSGAFFVEHT